MLDFPIVAARALREAQRSDGHRAYVNHQPRRRREANVATAASIFRGFSVKAIMSSSRRVHVQAARRDRPAVRGTG
jgi:hypothetical protein